MSTVVLGHLFLLAGFTLGRLVHISRYWMEKLRILRPAMRIATHFHRGSVRSITHLNALRGIEE